MTITEDRDAGGMCTWCGYGNDGIGHPHDPKCPVTRLIFLNAEYLQLSNYVRGIREAALEFYPNCDHTTDAQTIIRRLGSQLADAELYYQDWSATCPNCARFADTIAEIEHYEKCERT